MASENETMRAEFEAWVRDGWPEVDSALMRKGDGYYWPAFQFRWEGWIARSSAPSAEAKDAERTGTVADIADSELLHRVVSNLSAKARRQPAWARISDVFALGSTYSAQLCRRFGRDPDTGKELDAAIAQQT